MNDGGLMRLRPNAGQKREREREIESDVSGGLGREGGEVEVMVAARSAARSVGRRAACRGREAKQSLIYAWRCLTDGRTD